jgi:hypothetical protein
VKLKEERELGTIGANRASILGGVVEVKDVIGAVGAGGERNVEQ